MPPHSPCPGQTRRNGSEESDTALCPTTVLSHSTEHYQMHDRSTSTNPRGTAESSCCSLSLCRYAPPPGWGPLGPGYLVATGAGAAVGAKWVIVAGALVLAGARQAGVTLGLDTQGRWACRMGGAEITINVGSEEKASICGHQRWGQSPGCGRQ